MVPMIDVVFQLVIFFMVSTTFKVAPGIALQLPESATAEPIAMTALVVSVVDREQIYVNDRQVTLADLERVLGDVVGSEGDLDPAAPVVIEGDAGVPYDLMVDVLDVLRVLGIPSASLRTREIIGR